ncbi:hypothetical protein CFOL_v3_14865 [Cephalotus follicularis]|uniref:Transmembrane protein n=1 Tax=Cephalotus follicularis TaxID=3775 RepID=A0A1Q3BTR5_CEPFO|nr:hypothetical protein CFOL_v3_14865 [Cephalotus follicularis]
MVRPLPNLPMPKFSFSLTPATTLCFVLIFILSIFSIVTSLCASHKSKKAKNQGEEVAALSDHKRPISKLHSSISSKALGLMSSMKVLLDRHILVSRLMSSTKVLLVGIMWGVVTCH